jgi:hypothetical protein
MVEFEKLKDIMCKKRFNMLKFEMGLGLYTYCVPAFRMANVICYFTVVVSTD